MITAGIVAEYDPFHLGHAYQMEKTREITGADCVMIVLGGDFLQRGSPSFTEKRMRARMAIDAGADLVVVLPYLYSVNSAREYARGAISILAGTGCVDCISFGCESDDLNRLEHSVSVMMRERDLAPLIKENLSKGLSYPESMTRAVENLGGKDAADVLRTPNNLLACEYIRAARELRTSLRPFPVLRIREKAVKESPDTETRLLSASEIRSLAVRQGVSAVDPFVPDSTAAVLHEIYQESVPSARQQLIEKRMLSLLRYRFLTTSRSDLQEIYSAGEGIEGRLSEAAADPRICSVAELARAAGTRRYTYARLMRLLTHILMNFRAGDFQKLRGTCCARVLAFNERGRELLAGMRKKTSIPVFSNLSRLDRYDGRIREMMEWEIRAAGLYEMLLGGRDLTGGEIRYVPYIRKDALR